jgi:H+/Cl- antiporter ClcA
MAASCAAIDRPHGFGVRFRASSGQGADHRGVPGPQTSRFRIAVDIDSDIVIDGAVDVVAAAVVGAACGASSAVFLRGLDVVTAARGTHPWTPWLLPLAAAVLLVVVRRFAGPASAGTALVLWRATTGQGEPVPRRLWLFALLGTWWTHLFGGSAGREGTALQMGGAIADGVVAVLRTRWSLTDEHRRRLLVAGLAGGFGSVFGTPVAGAVFALEVVVEGRVEVRRALPAVVAAVTGDVVGDALLRAVGGHHGAYPVVGAVDVTPGLLAASAALGLIAGVVAVVFLALVTGVRRATGRLEPAWRGIVTGVVVVVIWQVSGRDDALGLSLPALSQAFVGHPTGALFAWKLVLTAVTIGGGLIGGEVTPLFVIGATLGASLSPVLHLPPAVAAVCGMVAVFGGAAATPLSLAFMAVELCGRGVGVPALIATVLATVVVRATRRSLYERLSPGLSPTVAGTVTAVTAVTAVADDNGRA